MSFKTGTVSIGTTPTLIYSATGDTKITIRNGNIAAVAIGNSSIAYPGGWMLSKDTPEAIVVTIELQGGESVYGVAGAAGTVINYLAQD